VSDKPRYLVVLDARSAVGRIYAKDNDGFVSDGEINHPILDCTQIVTDSPYYIFATRPLKKEGKSHQSLYLPHGSVAVIHQYAETEPYPIGFAPPQ
jgi:hypothetical protein